MKTIVKTVKTLELIWPNYSLASSMCRILDRLEEDLVPYWELYWDGEREEIGIRFASEEGVIEGGYAVRMRKNLSDENAPTTRIDERKRTVARTRRIRLEHGAVDPDDIAEELGGELVRELHKN